MIWRNGSRAERQERKDYWTLYWHMNRVMREACIGAGITQPYNGPLGTVPVPPELYGMSKDTRTLWVKMLPGMLVEDFTRNADRLAEALNCVRVRIIREGNLRIRIDRIDFDPLREIMHPRASDNSIILGITEHGETIRARLSDIRHIVAQGFTGSGKSYWIYRLVEQLSRRPDVLIAGCDPSGLIFRPFIGTRHENWQCAGTLDAWQFAKTLQLVADEMDARIRSMPDGRDSAEITVDSPLILVVMEELLSIYRFCDLTNDKSLGKTVRALIARIIGEGRKANIRMLLSVLRAEAALMGGFEREQCEMRLTFGAHTLESIRLLHPSADTNDANLHLAALPGVALYSSVGTPLERMRAEYIGGYGEYWNAVQNSESVSREARELVEEASAENGKSGDNE